MRKKQGFTLIEMSIAIGFIAAMAAYMIIPIIEPLQKAKEEIAQNKASMLNNRLSLYKYLKGSLPSSVDSPTKAIDLLSNVP